MGLSDCKIYDTHIFDVGSYCNVIPNLGNTFTPLCHVLTPLKRGPKKVKKQLTCYP